MRGVLAILLLVQASLAFGADGGLRQSVMVRLGANGGIQLVYFRYAAGENYAAGWSMLRPTSTKWDFQLGATLQHSVQRDSRKNAHSKGYVRQSMGVVSVPIDLIGRRWLGARDQRWFMTIGAQAVVQLWGYHSYSDEEDSSKEFTQFFPAVLPHQYRERDSRYECIYPLIPSFVLGVGYRFAQCPVEVSAELVQEGLFRFFPQLYHPIAHLFGYTYGGVSVSWWF